MRGGRFLRRAALAAAAFGVSALLAACAAGPAWAGKWKEDSRRHEEDCKTWCDGHKPECHHCSTLKNCGSGYENLKSWTGYGKNWHAC